MWPVALLGAGAALLALSNRGPKNTTEVQSRTNGKTYSVQNLPDKQNAADMMGKVHDNLDKLMNHYKEDPATMADPRIQTMISRFNPNNLIENDLHEDSTSYSENKGEKIVVCIRDKSDGYPLVDENTIMFVVLHEMAHLMTTTVGHTPEFWTNFRRILQDACKIGIYTEVNYTKNPTNYCGMTITDTPL
jgi:hypothetical protein